VRDSRLRGPIPRDLQSRLKTRPSARFRRGPNYMLMDIGGGKPVKHLGMSGNLRWCAIVSRWQARHVDIEWIVRFGARYTDPGVLVLPAWIKAAKIAPLFRAWA